eukprot:COSAG03_NODE_870_length_5566_cov_355.528809_2_plen_66_part_00
MPRGTARPDDLGAPLSLSLSLSLSLCLSLSLSVCVCVLISLMVTFVLKVRLTGTCSLATHALIRI